MQINFLAKKCVKILYFPIEFFPSEYKSSNNILWCYLYSMLYMFACLEKFAAIPWPCSMLKYAPNDGFIYLTTFIHNSPDLLNSNASIAPTVSMDSFFSHVFLFGSFLHLWYIHGIFAEQKMKMELWGNWDEMISMFWKMFIASGNKWTDPKICIRCTVSVHMLYSFDGRIFSALNFLWPF